MNKSYLNHLLIHSKESFLRFPLAILSSLLAVLTALYMVEFEASINNMFPLINILLASALGIPSFFCLTIFIEKKKLNYSVQLYSTIGVACLLILIYFTLPDSNVTHNTYVPYIRYFIYNIIIHLLVSFVPYLSANEQNGFWNYNKILFIRVWTSILYSGFLYSGLMIALWALRILFNIEIHDNLYFETFIVIKDLFQKDIIIK